MDDSKLDKLRKAADLVLEGRHSYDNDEKVARLMIELCDEIDRLEQMFIELGVLFAKEAVDGEIHEDVAEQVMRMAINDPESLASIAPQLEEKSL